MLGKRDVIGLLLILGIIGTVAFSAYAVGVPLCLFRHFTGIPCPCCGTTRACLSVLRGDLVGALKFNPLAVIAIFTGPFALWLMTRRKAWSIVAFVLSRGVIVLAVLLNWAYLIYSALG